MQVDNMITLANGMNYGLLLQTELDNNSYFLAVELDAKEEPTNNFKVLKELNENGKTFVVEEKDPIVLAKLHEDFSLLADDIEE